MTRGDLLEALMDGAAEWQAVDDRWLPILKESLSPEAYAQLTEGYLRDRLIDTLRGAGVEVVTDRSLLEAALGSEGVRQHRVYHGSGAFFPRFESEWIGTGQGFASYGWGFYFTEVESIGRDYAKEYAGVRLYYKGELKDTHGLYNPWRLIGDVFEECNKSILLTRDRLEHLMYLAENLPMKLAWASALSIMENIHRGDLKIEPERVLYTVDIPDDNGCNYLAWEQPVPESLGEEILDELSNQPADRAHLVEDWLDRQLRDQVGELVDNKGWSEEEVYALQEDGYAKYLPNDVLREQIEEQTDFLNGCKGEELYGQLLRIFGSGPVTGRFFNDMGIVGISYPTQFLYKGGREDGARNQVIFDEKDIHIEQRLRFLRQDDGTVYGLTDGERIFVDRSVASAATPIHEYAHLWIAAFRQQCPEEWAELTASLKTVPQWVEVARRYPELRTDSEIAEELLATFSGERGRERLLSELDRSGSQGWAGCVQSALRQVWRWVGGLFLSPQAKLEWFSDRILADLLRQREPGRALSRDRVPGRGM